jgi:hypothetical protein
MATVSKAGRTLLPCRGLGGRTAMPRTGDDTLPLKDRWNPQCGGRDGGGAWTAHSLSPPCEVIAVIAIARRCRGGSGVLLLHRKEGVHQRRVAHVRLTHITPCGATLTLLCIACMLDQPTQEEQNPPDVRSPWKHRAEGRG